MGPDGPLPDPPGSARSQLKRQGAPGFSGSTSFGSVIETTGTGTGGGSGSERCAGAALCEGGTFVRRGGAGVAATTGGGGVGLGAQSTIGPSIGLWGGSAGAKAGNRTAAVRATAWAAIDKGRTVARLPKRPAGGADTTRSSNILPFICVASVY